MKKMKLESITPDRVTVIEGRTLDPDSHKRAVKRMRRYHAVIRLSAFVLFFSVLPLCFALAFSGDLLDYDMAQTVSIALCPVGAVAGVISAYYAMKAQVYTGRCGYEQLDEAGSPYVGNAVTKKGRMKPILLPVSLLLIVGSAALVLYFVLFIEIPQTFSGFKDMLKWSALCASLTANTFFVSLYIYYIFVYGMKDFVQKLRLVFVGYAVPFLLFQLGITVVSALIYLLMTRLADTQSANAVVETVGMRVLDEAFDTTSLTGFLAGESSVISSLSAVSLFMSFTNTIIDHIADNQAQSHGKQFKEMLFDKDTIRMLVLLIATAFYIGFSRFHGGSGFVSALIRIALFIVWLVSNVTVFFSVQPVRYLFALFPFLGFDCILPMPSVTDVKSALLALLVFAGRTVGFLFLGLLIGYCFRFIQDMSVLEPDPEKKDAQQHAAEPTLGDFTRQAIKETREEERIKQQKKAEFEKTAAGKTVKVLKKAGVRAVEKWFGF